MDCGAEARNFSQMLDASKVQLPRKKNREGGSSHRQQPSRTMRLMELASGYAEVSPKI